MRVQKVHIENFKGIDDLHMDFYSADSPWPRDFSALTGSNGSGKTSALQAIGLTMALATKQIRQASDFGWHGFLADRISTLGNTRVELEVAFNTAEIAAVSEIFETWLDSRDVQWLEQNPVTRPGTADTATLLLENGRVRCVEGRAEYNQFLGRYYIKVLTHTHPRLRSRFRDVGDVFWFDQYRNLGALRAGGQGKEHHAGWTEAGVERLRRFLISMWSHHASEEKKVAKDYIDAMERMMAMITPGVRFHGVEPRGAGGRGQGAYVLLEHDGRVYDIAEMSTGEQIVFPLIYEFVRLGIARSVVLIDELELHLHPAEQKKLLQALPQMGTECQFIVSTHSPYLEEIIPVEEQVRLGGDLWNV